METVSRLRNCVVCGGVSRAWCHECQGIAYCSRICYDIHALSGKHRKCRSAVPSSSKQPNGVHVEEVSARFASEMFAAYQQQQKQQTMFGNRDSSSLPPPAPPNTPVKAYEKTLNDGVRDLDAALSRIDDQSIAAYDTYEASDPADDESDQDLPATIIVQLVALETASENDDDAFARALCIAKDALAAMLSYFLRLVNTGSSVFGRVLRGIGQYVGLSSALNKIKALVVTCVARVAELTTAMVQYLRSLISRLVTTLRNWMKRAQAVTEVYAESLAALIRRSFEVSEKRTKQLVLYLTMVVENSMLIVTRLKDTASIVLDRLLLNVIEKIVGLLFTDKKRELVAEWLDDLLDSPAMQTLTRWFGTARGAVMRFGRFLTKMLENTRISKWYWQLSTLVNSLVEKVMVMFGALLPEWLSGSRMNVHEKAKADLVSITTHIQRFGKGSVPVTLLSINNFELTQAAFEETLRLRQERGDSTALKRMKRVLKAVKKFQSQRTQRQTSSSMGEEIIETARDIGPRAWNLAGLVAGVSSDDDDDDQEAEKVYSADALVKRKLGGSLKTVALRATELEMRMASEIELFSLEQRPVIGDVDSVRFTARTSLASASRLGAVCTGNTNRGGEPYRNLEEVLEGVVDSEGLEKRIDELGSEKATMKQHASTPLGRYKQQQLLQLEALKNILENDKACNAILRMAQDFCASEEAEKIDKQRIGQLKFGFFVVAAAVGLWSFFSFYAAEVQTLRMEDKNNANWRDLVGAKLERNPIVTALNTIEASGKPSVMTPTRDLVLQTLHPFFEDRGQGSSNLQEKLASAMALYGVNTEITYIRSEPGWFGATQRESTTLSTILERLNSNVIDEKDKVTIGNTIASVNKAAMQEIETFAFKDAASTNHVGALALRAVEKLYATMLPKSLATEWLSWFVTQYNTYFAAIPGLNSLSASSMILTDQVVQIVTLGTKVINWAAFIAFAYHFMAALVTIVYYVFKGNQSTVLKEVAGSARLVAMCITTFTMTTQFEVLFGAKTLDGLKADFGVMFAGFATNAMVGAGLFFRGDTIVNSLFRTSGITSIDLSRDLDGFYSKWEEISRELRGTEAFKGIDAKTRELIEKSRGVFGFEDIRDFVAFTNNLIHYRERIAVQWSRKRSGKVDNERDDETEVTQ